MNTKPISPGTLVAGNKFVNDDEELCLVYSIVWEKDRKRWIIIYTTESMASEVMCYIYEGDTIEMLV